MSGPENAVKARVRKLLASMGAYQFPVQSAGLGEAGHPDRVACIQGTFVGIECKSDRTRHPTALQGARLTKLAEAGGLAFVVDADNFEAFSALLKDLFRPGVGAARRASLWAARDISKHLWWR